MNSFASFGRAVRNHFKSSRNLLTQRARELHPEADIKEVRLGGSYAAGSETEDSDVDLEVHYRGSVADEEVHKKLTGKLFGHAGAYDIVPVKVKK